VTVQPPDGAGPPKVKVPVAVPPDPIPEGVIVTDCKAVVPTVKVFVNELAPKDAVMSFVNWMGHIWGVETEKFADVEPVGTVTVAGTVT